MIISMIVAAGENNVIGKGNEMVWHLPDDFKYFKDKTSGHYIIMGRKTFETFDSPLPNRTSVVVTHDENYTSDDAMVTHTIEDALELAERNGEREAFIIGGGQIYKQSVGLADRIYLTRVHGSFEGDVIFPDIDEDEWELVDSAYHGKDERHKYAFTFEVYERSITD